jgi:hypothetical protein
MSVMLIEKYTRTQMSASPFQQGRYKRNRSTDLHHDQGHSWAHTTRDCKRRQGKDTGRRVTRCMGIEWEVRHDHQEGSLEQKSHAIVLCGSEREQRKDGGQGTVLIGSMPCKLSSEIHINMRIIFGRQDGRFRTCARQVTRDATFSLKRRKLWTAEGREIVGPRYSCPPR